MVNIYRLCSVCRAASAFQWAAQPTKTFLKSYCTDLHDSAPLGLVCAKMNRFCGFMGLPLGINEPTTHLLRSNAFACGLETCAILCLFPTPTNVNIGLSWLPLTNFELVDQELAKTSSTKVNCLIFVGVCWIIFTQTKVTCDQMQLLLRYSDSCLFCKEESVSNSVFFNRAHSRDK